MFLVIIVVYIVINLASADYCTNLLHHLADKQSKLMYCITTESVPVTMCINCVENYTNVLKSYDTLEQNCSNVYFNKDRINLVASTQSVLTGLWSKAFCDDCSNNDNAPKFNDKYNSLYKCLNDNKDDPCTSCTENYLDLNTFYINLDQHNNGEVCYDLQDQMNRTRNKWSKELKCCRREKNLILFAIVFCITCSLPLLFYVSTFLITRHQQRSYQVLYDEVPPNNSELPSSSGAYRTNDLNNTTQSLLNSNAVANKLSTKDKKGSYPKDVIESSDDEPHLI